MSTATAFLRVDFPVGFLLLLAFAVTLATLILFCLYTLRHGWGCADRGPGDELGPRSLLSYALRAELGGLLTFF